MKIKKAILAVAVILTGIVLASCSFEPPITVKNITAYDNNENQVPFENGSTNVNPNISYFEIRFENEMNKNYRDAISNFWNDISSNGWVNSYTYRLYCYLTYDTDYKFTINDSSYESDDYTPELSFWRDVDGAYVKQTSIEFTTKKQSEGKKEYTIDGSMLKKDWPVQLAYNEYGMNMQRALYIKDCFNHNKLKKGDTITFNFDIEPNGNLPPIFVNIVDDSYAANYWLPLAQVNDNSVDYKLTAEPMKSGKIYPVSLTFTITDDQLRNCILVFTSTDYDNDGKPDNKKYNGDIGFSIKAKAAK